MTVIIILARMSKIKRWLILYNTDATRKMGTVAIHIGRLSFCILIILAPPTWYGFCKELFFFRVEGVTLTLTFKFKFKIKLNSKSFNDCMPLFFFRVLIQPTVCNQIQMINTHLILSSVALVSIKRATTAFVYDVGQQITSESIFADVTQLAQVLDTDNMISWSG